MYIYIYILVGTKPSSIRVFSKANEKIVNGGVKNILCLKLIFLVNSVLIVRCDLITETKPKIKTPPIL